MRFPYSRLVALALAASSTAYAQLTGPFYLTIVPKDGSTPYPVTVATVSRGAQILSSALEYVQEFTFDTTTGRIFKADEPTNGNRPFGVDTPFLFNGAGGDGSALEQVVVDGETYLVKAGAAAESVYAWWSVPTPDGLPINVFWEGAGNSEANAALKIGS